MQENCLALLHAISEETKEFILIFKDEKILFSNHAFNSFFGISSIEDFTANFRNIVECFVPHPSYFNAQKIEQGQSWFEAILALDEIDRVVSFLSQNHDPHAFSVKINQDTDDYSIVTFSDITQTLIKRILIDNHMNIDTQSGAYAKEYFLHIKQSFEDAAAFNEKHIALTLITIQTQEEFDPKEIADILKNNTRDDDMIIRWATEQFLMAYLVDDAAKAQAVGDKLQTVLHKHTSSSFGIELFSVLQQEHEKIARLLNRVTE
jgi:hypothetical protein